MKEFISIFTSAYAENPRETRATVAQTLCTFFILAAAFLSFIYLFA